MPTDDLRSQVRGQVLGPGDDGYDAGRRGWNLSVQHRPATIVMAANADDVAAGVRFAVAEGLPVAVQATGHGPSVPAHGAVLINTRNMTGLSIDPSARTARIGPGVTWDTLLLSAAEHGLAPLVGTCPTVGVVGYLTSGGLPALCRRYGFAADHVRSLDLVTADGEMRHASETENADVYWAVRGGKGNFGIVTSIETDLMTHASIYGGSLIFPGKATRTVLQAWRDWTATQTDGMNSSLALIRVPDLPAMPEELRGKFIVSVRVACTGSVDDGERLVRPLRALTPMMDTMAELPYSRIATIYNSPTEPAPVQGGGFLFRAFDQDTIERLTALAGPDITLPPGQIEIRHLGGAIEREPARPNAIGHRGAPYSLQYAMLAPPERVEAVLGAQQTLVDGLRPWSAGTKFPTLLDNGDTTPEQVRTAYTTSDYERLQAIKAIWDPGNLFRINHNIPPAR